MDDACFSLETDTSKDPRALLQKHAFCFLREAGWRIERHKRSCRKYEETFFRSPEGKIFREFPTAWRSCGQSLLVDRYNFTVADDGRLYTDVNQFWSDVITMLNDIEEESNSTNICDSLAYRWTVLDPFVSLVLVHRKISLLKRGVAVKAVPSLATYKRKKHDADKLLLQSPLSDSSLPCRSS